MSKILLTLGLVAALASPAAAGRLDADPAQLTSATAVDTVVTRSIGTGSVTGADAEDRLAENGKLFGADSR